MCLENLARRIEESISNQQWAPIPTSRRGLCLSHAFYADDIVLFREASQINLQVIMEVLQRFCYESGEIVSLEKSKIFFFY